MLDNNNFNSENNGINTVYGMEENYNANGTAEVRRKGNGAKKAVKAVLTLLCMAVISVGSIIGYKYVDENGIPFIDSGKPVQSEEVKELPEKDEEKENKDKEEKNELLKDTSLVDIKQGTKSMSTQSIYKKVLPSVVGITSMFQYQEPSFDFWGFGDTTTREAAGTGTGIVLSADGYILTNAHVISSDKYGVSEKITIRLDDETEYDAEIVGYDTQTDLAVLKADANHELIPAEFGSSQSLCVGDPVLAIGNPLGFDLFGTLTAGYVSGLNREISVNDNTMKLIQTDAAINSGNSGGPLINEYGQVIGINSMKLSNSYSSSSASIEGLGFAIPIDDAKKIIDDLTAYGYVKGRPQLGITYKDLSENYSYGMQGSGSGVLVVSVNKGGAADKAGIQAGDIIVGADGEIVTSASDLKSAIAKCTEDGKPGKLRLTVVRNRSYYDVNVTLEEAHPDSEN